ncbi:hypothetical protein GYMLUDRAFT_249202 [Collybiopsis luxurians FD-317 M1]|uniref:Uncharacterized protein n=1 Tax=Collybiopsis luxurians FD-317 M1 TaxID=944289 RepID=A0A0D0CIN1_9AGAR|nr:hypothetical protein GYMLUDRAFT_249202 [Collybiopsis luxurians FD-317 M1]
MSMLTSSIEEVVVKTELKALSASIANSRSKRLKDCERSGLDGQTRSGDLKSELNSLLYFERGSAFGALSRHQRRGRRRRWAMALEGLDNRYWQGNRPYNAGCGSQYNYKKLARFDAARIPSGGGIIGTWRKTGNTNGPRFALPGSPGFSTAELLRTPSDMFRNCNNNTSGVLEG